MNPKVSVIVPVYNAAKFLKRGVDSLLKQTYENIEILLVDDFSTDDSFRISNDLATKDSRIVVLQNLKKSGGPLRGRELGILKSKGEWITFMDCDDFVSKEYIEHLLETTDKGKYDIAVTGYSKWFSKNRIKPFNWTDFSQTTDQRLAEFYKNFLSENFWTNPSDTIGQNLIRSDIAKKAAKKYLIKQPSDIWAEDTFMALSFIACSKNGINFRDFHDFYWRQREGSGSHGGFSSFADKKSFYLAMNQIFIDNFELMSKNLPLISVIIPAYGVERYISACVDSVIKQNYKNLEIIIVDDKSPDKSGKIADEYAKKDSRIKVVHKQVNEGLNMARKTGFENSKGKYITFVDSDDMISKDYVESLLRLIVREKSDISMVGYSIFTKNSDLPKNEKKDFNSTSKIYNSKFDRLNLLISGFGNIGNIYPMTAWGKMYSRRIIKQTDWKMANYRINEDELTSLQWYTLADGGIVSENSELYFYRKNLNGLANNAYINIDPDGNKIDKFQFIKDLYNKSLKYVHDTQFEKMLLDRMQNQNNFFHEEYREKNILTPEMQNNFIYNYDLILQKKDEIIKMMTNQNSELFEQNNNLNNSLNGFLSTKRSFKLFMGNIKRMVKHKIRLIHDSKIKDPRFSIITANCLGGVIYNKLGIRMNSPTINMWMNKEDFLEFSNNLRDFIENGKFNKISEKWQDDLNFFYPIACLSIPGHKITINFNHHNSMESAIEDWDRRKNRINYDRIFILFANEEPDINFYQRFSDIPWKNKLILTTKRVPFKYKSIAKQIHYNEEYRGDWTMQGDKQNKGKMYFERWKYIKWLDR